LSKYQKPDLSSFSDPEVCFKVPLDYYAGLIIQSDKREQILELLRDYVYQLITDFKVVMPQDKVSKLHE
jgi:hypothetical protein